MREHAKGGLFMNKERLEWVLSGLNRYKLNQKEDQFVKSTEYDFNQKDMITEQQEETLEGLYKEKSRFLPNRNYFSPKGKHSHGKEQDEKVSSKIHALIKSHHSAKSSFPLICLSWHGCFKNL